MLTTNDPNNPQVTISLKIQYPNRLVATPHILKLGDLKPGQPATAPIQVQARTGASKATITGIETSTPNLTVRQIGVEEEDWGRQFRYEVTFLSTNPVIQMRENIFFHSDIPEMPILELIVTGSHTFPFRSTPPRLHFGFLETNTTTVKQAVIAAAKDTTITPVKATCADPRVTLKLLKGKKPKEWILEAAFTPGQDRNRLTAPVYILNESGTVIAMVALNSLVRPRRP